MFGNVRCNQNQDSLYLYCNEDNGWCGNTIAHRDAQPSDEYDYNPETLYTLDIVIYLLLEIDIH